VGIPLKNNGRLTGINVTTEEIHGILDEINGIIKEINGILKEM